MSPRVVRLPPLKENTGERCQVLTRFWSKQIFFQKWLAEVSERSTTVLLPFLGVSDGFRSLTSSNPKSNTPPIDFVLVYDPLDPTKNPRRSPETAKEIKKIQKRREKYEKCLKETHGLFLEPMLVSWIDRSIDQFRFDFLRRTNRAAWRSWTFTPHSKFFCSQRKIFECVCRSK